MGIDNFTKKDLNITITMQIRKFGPHKLKCFQITTKLNIRSHRLKNGTTNPRGFKFIDNS